MRPRRSAVLLTLFCSTTAMLGCMRWSEPSANVQEVVAKHRASVQLTLMDGRIVRLNDPPTLRGDSIVEQAYSNRPQPRVFATSDVRLIQTRQYNPEKTLLVFVGIPGAAFLAFLGLVAYTCGQREC